MEKQITINNYKITEHRFESLESGIKELGITTKEEYDCILNNEEKFSNGYVEINFEKKIEEIIFNLKIVNIDNGLTIIKIPIETIKHFDFKNVDFSEIESMIQDFNYRECIFNNNYKQ